MNKIGKRGIATGSTPPDHAHKAVSESRCAQELERHHFLRPASAALGSSLVGTAAAVLAIPVAGGVWNVDAAEAVAEGA
ncbi:hypothetical protein [Streptomyces sp. NPDC001292]|uniref:hypothetical protein n=1 Tax=Streptomyces sp. NPDC001292 TaxID=3364558 RepID=UPI0036B4F519